MLKQINILLDHELNDRIFEAAHELRLTKSQYIRQAIEEKLGKVAPFVATPEKHYVPESPIKIVQEAMKLKEAKGTQFHPVPKPGKKKGR